MSAVFVGYMRMGLGPGTLPYQDIRNPPGLGWAYGFVREYTLFVLFKHGRQ